MSAEPGSAEPEWLAWARALQAIAQTGLAFTRDPYDTERYEMLRDLAARIATAGTGADQPRLVELFTRETGYATPKIDVRAAAFNAAGEILMVREVMDAGRWTLPGGWADVGVTPAENAVKEAREETGFDVRVRKVAAVWDRTRQGHQPQFFSAQKLFFLCDIVGGAAATSLETSEVAFFAEGAVPTELSLGRVLPQQISRMFAHWRDPSLPTEFD